MNLLITGGFGHIGSHIINNINKIKSIKKLYIIDYFYKNKPNSLFNLKKSKTKIFIINKDLSKSDSLKKFPITFSQSRLDSILKSSLVTLKCSCLYLFIICLRFINFFCYCYCFFFL